MPRFCSSKARPNSTLTGLGISVATSLKALGRAWPARSERAIMSSASGSCSDSFRLRFSRMP